MPQGLGEPYAYDLERGSDGALLFRCSRDVEAWPWLALAPQHPIVIQTQQFWASFCALQFEGRLEEGQWSALTWMDYAIRDPQAQHAVRGVYNRIKAEAGPAFALTLYDHGDREIVRMRGRGVVFRNRNFEEWREGYKREARNEGAQTSFAYADRARLGLDEGEHPFVAPLRDGLCEALVTAENGFAPGNPYIGGSGDHVNTTHFGEVTRQAARLVTGNAALEIAGGEMTLNRYVELGTLFTLRVVDQEAHSITFQIEQLGKTCALIALRW